MTRGAGEWRLGLCLPSALEKQALRRREPSLLADAHDGECDPAREASSAESL
jgi:hypothetical protein